MSIVLGDGPATAMLVRFARLGLGGPQLDHRWPQHDRYRGIGPRPSGSGASPWHDSRGRQMLSWMHVDDVVGTVRVLIDHDEITGPVNLASPNPADNRTLMRELRRAVGMPFGMPVPRAVLEPAMWLLRTEPELVLKGRWVTPGVLAEAGYAFQHPIWPRPCGRSSTRPSGRRSRRRRSCRRRARGRRRSPLRRWAARAPRCARRCPASPR